MPSRRKPKATRQIRRPPSKSGSQQVTSNARFGLVRRPRGPYGFTDAAFQGYIRMADNSAAHKAAEERVKYGGSW